MLRHTRRRHCDLQSLRRSQATCIPRSKIVYAPDDQDGDTCQSTRVAALLSAEGGQSLNVWIQWREYTPVFDMEKEVMVPPQSSVERVQKLVILLECDKLKEFCAPTCHGHFDDRDGVVQEEQPRRFGLVFEVSQFASPAAIPETLYAMLGQETLSISDRMKLAQRLATSVLYLHAVSRLHKGVNSRNSFFPDPADLSTVYLSGFEYARPDTSRDRALPGKWNTVDQKDELYRHPSYQGPEPKRTYCIAGHVAFAVECDGDETAIVTSTKLQWGFMTHVVDALAEVAFPSCLTDNDLVFPYQYYEPEVYHGANDIIVDTISGLQSSPWKNECSAF